MAGRFNSKNRRLAKLRSKGSWFKGRQEVEPPKREAMEPVVVPEMEVDDRNVHEGRTEEMERNQPSILSGGSRLDTTLTVPAGRGTEFQQRIGQTGGKEKSRRKESGSPRKGIKGKKRGLNRELITLGGKKKQETLIRRTLKRKMNQQRGKAGIPAIS